VVAYPFVALPLYRKTFQSIGMQTRDYLRGLRPAIDATIAMAIAVGLLKWSIPVHRLLIRLILEVAVGGSAYVVTLLALHGERVMSYVRMAQSFWRNQKNI
jgi:hypothetical protein